MGDPIDLQRKFMGRYFKNPTNGHQEEVGIGDSVGVFFLGALYLAIKGLWAHVFIWLMLVVPLSVATSGVGIVIFVPIACIAYAVGIQSALANAYLKKGWVEVDDRGRDLSNLPVKVAPDLTSNRFMNAAVVPPTATTKACPFCAEEIKIAAVKCKHCGSELPKEEDTQTEALNYEEITAELMKKHNIMFWAGKYCFKEYKYDTLEDAIAYAEKQT